MPSFFIWSGNLRGVPVEDEYPEDAVVTAVKGNVPCTLGALIRATRSPEGEQLPGDVYWAAPYEDTFPELFDGTLEVYVCYGEAS